MANPDSRQALGLLFYLALWLLFGREEWQARLGLLEVRKALFGFRRTARFTDATLRICLQYISSWSGYGWVLSVEMPGRGWVLTNNLAKDMENWEGSGVGKLAEILAGATHFPVQDEGGEVRPWLASLSPGTTTGSMVQIRHLHTGQVMEQVPGGTLAGAHLAKAILEGADLRGADLQGADIADAHLEGASLKDAKLANAKLAGALLTAADLTGADLTGADLTGAKLLGATYDGRTRWPQGFEAARRGAVLAE